MPAFKIYEPQDDALTTFPALKGVGVQGEIGSRNLFPMPGRPLRAWIHELQPGSAIEWNAPPVGHAVYVLSGEISANGERVGKSGAALAEHGASMTVKSPEHSKILHFHQDESGDAPQRAGGKVHVLDDKGIYQFKPTEGVVSAGAMYAESACPTCELWLHSSLGRPAGSAVSAHYHTVDEIIFVLEGSMLFGRHDLPAGGAVAMDSYTTYRFAAGANGLSFLNFRSCEPRYGTVSKEGKLPASENERERFRARFAG